MLKGYRRFCALALAIASLAGLAACSGQPAQPDSPTDILTQKALLPDRIPVTVLVKSAFFINSFEQTVEARFPELDLIQVGNYSADMGIAEYEARLKNGDLTDLVMTWPLDVGEAYWAEQLMDLSALPITSRYITAMLDDISREGKLYYLPGPSQIRGILYNKTLFQEKGWQLPKSFEEFVTLCQTIEESGIRALQLGLGNQEVLDTAFVGYGYEDSYSTPENARRIADYDAGKGSFADNYGPALETFQVLIDEGILQRMDLDLTYADREQMIFNRQCAMVEDSVLMARMGRGYNGCTDEFALMPFWNPGLDSDWARLYPVCYIGVNKKLTQPANKAKYDLVMKLLDYISTPEGQAALSGDTSAVLSALNGVAPPNIPEIADLLPALTHGRYARFPTLKNAQSALRTGLAGMVTGTKTAADVVKLVDAQNASPPIPASLLTLGTATEDFTLIETGSFLTDAMREYCDSDFALFLDNGKDGRFNGKGINGRIYKGAITESDIRRILPDLRYREKGELWKVTMTGADLIQTLEHAIPVDNDKTGWFYYFSGLRMEYAPAAAPGSRIRKLTTSSGKAIDPGAVYSVAVADESIPAELIQSCEKPGILIHQLLASAVTRAKTLSPSGDRRFVVAEP